MKKINIKEFQASKLTLNERFNVKGGSGATISRRCCTRSNGCGHDAIKWDAD